MIEVIINGKNTSLPNNITTVEQVLHHLQINHKNVAVDINGQLVPRSTFASHQIAANNKIEIIHFVGGG